MRYYLVCFAVIALALLLALVFAALSCAVENLQDARSWASPLIRAGFAAVVSIAALSVLGLVVQGVEHGEAQLSPDDRMVAIIVLVVAQLGALSYAVNRTVRATCQAWSLAALDGEPKRFVLLGENAAQAMWLDPDSGTRFVRLKPTGRAIRQADEEAGR
jgi:lysylphosphatidylglycerol synthetase-like protein (DUF2156 family)